MIGTMPNENQRSKATEGQIVQAWKSRPLLLVFTVCLLIELSLVLLDLYVNWFRWADSSAIRRMFNITREDGLASLFAVIQTLFVALVLWLIYILTARKPGGKKQAGAWLILALFFSYMVIDDGAMVHERIGTAFKQANEGIELSSYAWQFVLAPLFVIMGLYMAWFLWRLENQSIRRGWLLAALACLGFAVLLDYVEGVEGSYMVLVEGLSWPEKTIAHFSKSLEEFLEMLGMSIFLTLFLDHLGFLSENTEIRFSGRKVQFIDRADPPA
jgi:hypothetical protein